jgi:hypothetical protein
MKTAKETLDNAAMHRPSTYEENYNAWRPKGVAKLLEDRDQLYTSQELKRAIRLGIWEGAKKQPNCPKDIEDVLGEVLKTINNERP